MGKITTTRYICDECGRELVPMNPDIPNVHIFRGDDGNPYQSIICTLEGQVLCEACFLQKLITMTSISTFMYMDDAKEILKKMTDGYEEQG